MKKIYLAGPISHLTYDETSGWRKYVTSSLSGHEYRTYDPVNEEEKARVKEGDKFCDGKNLPQLTLNEIFTRDMFWVKDSDIILADFTIVPPSLGGGTPFELGAAWALNKPIIVVGPKSNIQAFTMLGSSVHFETLDEAISFLKTIA